MSPLNSFLAWMSGAPSLLVDHLRDLEAEALGVPDDYDHWQEVWALEQSCPPGMRVGYLPFNGKTNRLGYVNREACPVSGCDCCGG